MNICKTDSKKYCMACKHYGYCDRANRCDGNCSECDDALCQNNPAWTNNGKIMCDDCAFDFYEEFDDCEEVDYE